MHDGMSLADSVRSIHLLDGGRVRRVRRAAAKPIVRRSVPNDRTSPGHIWSAPVLSTAMSFGMSRLEAVRE